MNDEEIKAIEKLKWYFKDSNSLDIAKQTYIVLNLIEKQKAEIERLNSIVKTDDIISKARAEVLEEFRAEIEKKDMIINEMEKYIDEITEKIAREKGGEDFEFCDNKCADKDEYIECKQCIKEYFENKVKEIPEKN